MQPPDRISRRKRARQIVAARLERLEDLSIGKLVPSTLTLLALCCGVTAIRFGSRVDVYLPPNTEILVRPGITTRAGETVLARFL